MDKIEFISQLRKKLQSLPNDEANNAVAYYEEYFDEAGPQFEARVIAELGSPSDVAAKILTNYAVKEKKGLSSTWFVVLGLLASPIALPLALALIIVFFCLVLTVAILVFTFGVTGFALTLSGLASAVFAATMLIKDFATALYFIGYALTGSALGLIFIKLTVALSKKSFNGLTKLMSKFVLRRKAA